MNMLFAVQQHSVDDYIANLLCLASLVRATHDAIIIMLLAVRWVIYADDIERQPACAGVT